MNLPVVFTPAARSDFDEAADWYEQRTGQGLDFATAVREVLDRIATMPLMHQVVYPDIQRAVVRPYPYSIFYRVEPDRITVTAVIHGRRNPAIWQARLMKWMQSDFGPGGGGATGNRPLHGKSQAPGRRTVFPT